MFNLFQFRTERSSTRDVDRVPHRSFRRLLPFCLLLTAILFPASDSFLWAGDNVWTSNGPEGGYVTAVLIGPADPNIIYAGTAGAGVFKSIDAGASWNDARKGLTDFFVTKVAIDPARNNTLYLGTSTGKLFKSIDGAASWSLISPSGWLGQPITCIAIHPTNTDILYAGTGFHALYMSSDEGLTWKNVGSALPGFVSDIAIDPANPSVIYAGIQGYGIYRSTDKGTTWNPINNGLTNQYVSTLLVDPNNPGTIYVASSQNVAPSALYKSTNGGENWTSFSTGLPTDAYFSSLLLISGAMYLGTSEGTYKTINGGMNWSAANNGLRSLYVFGLAKGAGNTVYAGTVDGVFRTTNGGNQWNLSNNGLVASVVWSMATDTAGRLYVGTDTGGVFKSTDSALSWEYLSSAPQFGSAMALAADPWAQTTLYLGMGGTAGLGKRADHGLLDDGIAGFYKSTDGGRTWLPANNGLNDKRISRLALDPINPGVIYAVTDTRLYKSRDEGTNWVALNGLPNGPLVLALDPKSPGTIYVAVYLNGVYKSTDGGMSWKASNTGLKAGMCAFALAIDPKDTGTIYAGSDGVFKSTDGGATWTRISQILGVGLVSSLAIDAADTRTIYAGTMFDGVYRSTDAGMTWQQINEGLTATSVWALSADTTRPGTIYAATLGGGVSVFSSSGSESRDLSVPALGTVSTTTSGASDAVKAGYASVAVNSGSAPYGTAVFSVIQNGVVISEAGVPASPPTTHAEIFIDYRTGVPAKSGQSAAATVNINTGIAVANTNGTTAHVTFTLRRADGTNPVIGNGTILGGAHRALFIDQLNSIAPDFVLPANFSTITQFGSLEIQSDQPLSILALRLTSNQRGDTLLTSTPIADLTKPPADGMLYFPQVVDGNGYTTTFMLLNTSGTTESGTLRLFKDDGSPLSVKQVNGPLATFFLYIIPPGGVYIFQTDGSPTSVNAGSVQVTPDPGHKTPVGAGVFRFTQNGIVVTESGIPSATPTTHARIYVDLSGGHNTGLAIAAPTSSAANITMNAFQLDGSTPAGTSGPAVAIEGNGHAAKFVGELVSGLPSGFTGVLDISAASPFVALTLRSLDNGRDFLLTTFPMADFAQPAPSPIVFPQIADGGGYKTQFILLSTSGAARTTLSFFGDDGSPMAVGKSAREDR